MDLNIFEKEHFKTLIQFKDYLKFENLLSQNGIPFFVESISNTNISNYCRYYFLQENREQVNLILQENAIIPMNEGYGIYDLQQSKKIYKIYGVIILAMIVILIVINLTYKLLH